MPSRDENGKRIPGCKQRASKAVREAPDPPAKKRAAKKKGEEPAADPFGWFSGPNPFDRIGPMPIGNTARLVSWGAQANGASAEAIMQRPNRYPSFREWMRAVLDATTRLGVVRDKAAEQDRIEEALHRDDVKGKKQGLTDVRGRKAQAASRPTG